MKRSTSANQDVRVAVVDDLPSAANKRVADLTAAELVAESVTSVARFKELVQDSSQWLFLMDFAYDQPSAGSDLCTYTNAAELLKGTSHLHRNSARVVLISRGISNLNRDDVTVIQRHARLEANLSAEEWDSDTAVWISRLRVLATVNPNSAEASFEHLHPEGRDRLISTLLAPFGRSWLSAVDSSASNAFRRDGVRIAILQGWSVNDPDLTTKCIEECLSAWTRPSVNIPWVGEDELCADLGPADMVGRLKDIVGIGSSAGPTSTGNGIARPRRPPAVVLLPSLQRVVESPRTGALTESQIGCVVALGNWLQDRAVAALSPPVLCLVPMDGARQIADELRSASGLQVVDLGLPTQAQLERRAESEIPWKDSIWSRSNQGDRERAKAALTNACVRHNAGYLGIRHIATRFSGTRDYDEFESLLVDVLTKGSPMVGAATVAARSGGNPLDQLAWRTWAEFTQVFPVPTGKREAGGVSVTLRDPGTGTVTGHSAGSDSAKSWVLDLNAMVGVSGTKNFTKAARAIVTKLHAAGIISDAKQGFSVRNDAQLVTRIANRLGDLYRGPSSGNRSRGGGKSGSTRRKQGSKKS